MRTHLRQIVVLIVLTASLASDALAQHATMPPGMTHEEHLAQLQREADLKKRGAVAMGFDQDATTHHFRLYKTGGAIEVLANQSGDSATISQVRTHLKQIAEEFARGDFGKPFATHDETPPGVPTMQQAPGAFVFRFEDLPLGGRVRITATDASARAALHEFLRYQIREHATGDSLEVSDPR
jgi:hypothetical protein